MGVLDVGVWPGGPEEQVWVPGGSGPGTGGACRGGAVAQSAFNPP